MARKNKLGRILQKIRRKPGRKVLFPGLTKEPSGCNWMCRRYKNQRRNRSLRRADPTIRQIKNGRIRKRWESK